jgi:hypothetical protein
MTIQWNGNVEEITWDLTLKYLDKVLAKALLLTT